MTTDGTESTEEKIARLTRERDEAQQELASIRARLRGVDGETTVIIPRKTWDRTWHAERNLRGALRDAEDRLTLVQVFRATGNEDLIDAALDCWTRKTEKA